MQLRPSRTFLVAFVGFYLMIAAWSFAVPYDGTPDEHDHVYRAVGVVSGEVAPAPAAAVRGTGAFQTVPAGLVASTCWQYERDRTPADCAGAEPTADRTPRRVGSGAGRYQPVYYAIVGVPLKLWPGWPGLILARLVSGAIAAALLAAAVSAITRYSRHRLMMAGLLAGVTPMATYFAGSINPNGVEIAAGVAFFAAAIPLFTGGSDRVDPVLLRTAGIGALWLATLRPIGLVFLVCAVLVLIVPWRAGNAGLLRRHREARRWAAAVAVAAVAAAGWFVAMRAGDLGDFRTEHYGPGAALLHVADRWPGLLDQMVGMTSWLVFVFMLTPAYTLWQLLAGALLVFALILGDRVDRWRLLGFAAAAFVVPMAIQIYQLNRTGFITQGRYLLPMAVGVLLLAASVVEERGLDQRRSRTFTRLMVVGLLPIHLLCLVTGMARWQQGLPPTGGKLTASALNPFTGRWHPPLGSVLPLLLEAAGLAILGWLAWTAHRRGPAAESVVVPAAEPVAVPAVEPATGAPTGTVPVQRRSEDAPERAERAGPAERAEPAGARPEP